MAGKLNSEQQSGVAHVFPVRVYYEDTDFSGVVYHASYLRFLERGRTEFLRAHDIHQQALSEGEQAIGFAVRRMTIDFMKAARMDDMLNVETLLTKVKGASIEMQQRILRGDDVLITADVVVACVANGRAARIPGWVFEKLPRF